jgi:bifunctional non-homologous end joining protein LigD
MCPVALKPRRIRKSDPYAVPGARRSPQPGFVQPCDPTLREQVPKGPDWIHEIKIDGYRAQLHIRDGRVTVYSRRGYDWTTPFRPIAEAAGLLAKHDLIIDGEVTVLDSNGRPDFQALRSELARASPGRLTYLAFDLLFLDGLDLRPAKLIARKQALQRLLEGIPPIIQFLGFLAEEDGQTIQLNACQMGLEGIVSKRRDALYRSGRQEIWVKIKCHRTETFPIVAFVEKLGARPRKVASLYIGRWDGDRLLYAGKVPTGYTEEVARELRERLDPLIIAKSPLSEPIRKPKATWVRPVVLAEVKYGSVTENGLLREASFKGLRDDLDPLRQPRPSRPHRDRDPA